MAKIRVQKVSEYGCPARGDQRVRPEGVVYEIDEAEAGMRFYLIDGEQGVYVRCSLLGASGYEHGKGPEVACYLLKS